MARAYDEAPKVSTTLAELTEEARHAKPPCCPPAIRPELQLKWGLALLGEEKAKQYLDWLHAKLEADSR